MSSKVTQLNAEKDWREAAEELHEEMQAFQGHPESYRFRPGDVVTGRILGYDTGFTDFGESPIAVLQEKGGRVWSVWLFHKVLLSKFNEVRPLPGEVVSIRRLDDSAKGYKQYHVAVYGRRRAMPDFSKYLPAEESQPALPPVEVEATREDEPDEDGIEITDDDIPF